jgi:hypothetical protein
MSYLQQYIHIQRNWARSVWASQIKQDLAYS